MSEYFEPGPPPTVEKATAIAQIRVSAWSLDDFVDYAIASIVESYFADPNEYWEDHENYKDQL